ncbi:MAG: AsmA family protein [Clostridium sp.]|nr:AsmA family protein [Clostridium sp.]
MNILKKTAIFIIACLVILYTGLYLGLPYVINSKDYSKILTDTVKKETGLIIVIHKYKLGVAPTLDVSLKADEIQAFYPDKKQFLDIKKAEVKVSVFYLLKKELRINNIKADEFQLSTKLLKSGKTTLQEYLEKNIKTDNCSINFSKELPKLKVKKYIIKIKDEKSGQKFKLAGNNFKISQNIDLHYVNFDSSGDFYCFDKRYVKYNLKLAVPKSMFIDIHKKMFDITADELYKYNLFANLNADLKVHAKDNNFKYLSGKIDIDKFTMKIGNQTLPPSFFHINLDKGKATVVSKFYTAKNESTDINANVKITKPYEIDMKCLCPKASISNLQKLTISVLELLKIKNNLTEFKADGTISADFEVQTNFKTLHSNGSLKVNNANIAHKNIPLRINKINALVDFSNDNIKIKQSDVLVNEQPVKIKGTIDSKANGNILISANNLDLNHIMNAFPMLKPQKNLVVKSGKLSFTTKIQGKLTEAAPQINALITNFNALETLNNIKISINELFIDADNKTLIINPCKINLGIAKIVLSGDIIDYLKAPSININASGTVDTALLKTFAPKDIKLFAQGYLPIKASVTGNSREQKIKIDILANHSNYITPLHINSFAAINTLTSAEAKLEGSNLTIDDISIFYANGINGLTKTINKNKLKKAISVKGKIKNYATVAELENLHISTEDKLNISLPEIKDSRADLTADLIINGTAQKPNVNGNILLTDVLIPQYFIKAQNIALSLNKSFINAQINNLKIKSMNVSIEAIAPTDALQTNNINYLKLNSQYIDMDYLMALMPLFEQAKYGPGTEFPFIIKTGKVNIKSFKTGQIKAENISADISSKKNVLLINKMFADAYGGKAAGNITYNFPYNSLHADIQGRNMDAASAAKDFLPGDQKISGRLNFDASVDMLGTSFEQQMKTLKGRADILVKNGHLGPLGRFEHFLYAQNLLSQKLIYASLNSAKQAISPKDTGFVTYLKGMIKFSSGYAHLNPVLTSGPQMSMYITGSINLLTNYTDLQILGRVSSEVSSSMGLLGTVTIKDFLDEHTKYGPAIANLFNSFNTEIPEMDISRIPALSPDYRYQTKNFRVVIEGDPDSVKSVKSFTWVNPTGTKKKALSQQEATKKEAAAEKQTPAILPEQNNVQKPSQSSAQPDFLNSIPDSFHE